MSDLPEEYLQEQDKAQAEKTKEFAYGELTRENATEFIQELDKVQAERVMNNLGPEELALANFDYDSLKIKPLEGVPDKQNVIIEYGYSVRILWSCGQHGHRWRFTAQLCNYFSK
jgi:hypothetical protein